MPCCGSAGFQSPAVPPPSPCLFFRLRSGPEPLHLAPISSLSFPLLRAKMPFQWSFEALNRPIPHSASGPSPLPRYRAGISHRFRGKAHSRGASFHSPNKDTVRSRCGYSLRPRLSLRKFALREEESGSLPFPRAGCRSAG